MQMAMNTMNKKKITMWTSKENTIVEDGEVNSNKGAILPHYWFYHAYVVGVCYIL